MPLFERPASIDLQTVLELERQPDGSARGALDGTSLELDRARRLHLTVNGVWPGAVETAIPHRAPGRLPKNLRNCATRQDWMDAALAQPEVSAELESLSAFNLHIEVAETSLSVTWRGTPDGPTVRRAAHRLVALAQRLPHAMTAAVRAEMAEQIERRAAHASRPRPPAPSVEALRRSLSWRLVWQKYSAIIFTLSAIPLGVVLTQMTSVWSFALGGVWFGVGWTPLLLACPRCQKLLRPWSVSRRPGVVDDACRHCGLRP